MMDWAQFKKHSDIIIQSQMSVANIQAARAVIKAQSTDALSTKAYKGLHSALGKQILRSGNASNTSSDLFNKRERNAAEWKTKKDFERKWRDFSRALQPKLSNERMK
jgi:hypothetical protein